MQLNQPIPPTYSGGENPYDFILQGPQKPKKTLIPTGGSQKQRILLAITGLIIFILLAVAIFGVLSSLGGDETQAILGIAQTQTELVRISTAGGNKARDLTTLGFAESVQLTLTTNQQQTTRYLTSQNVKINPKVLVLGQKTQTDASLKSAEQAGRYDEELLTVLQNSLSAYKTQLNSAYQNATSVKQKNLLLNLYNQANALTKNQPTKS